MTLTVNFSEGEGFGLNVPDETLESALGLLIREFVSRFGTSWTEDDNSIQAILDLADEWKKGSRPAIASRWDYDQEENFQLLLYP